ncbi:unnamed protein product [Adineta ricciae]|uniref:Phosphatidylinositol-3-phosphatase n=1 Tax=Adineta ricciae TaxID=249248 RepID=A0A815TLE4_ADIRI|nr:unnamed protein product [Adineta ricciae]
MKKSNEPKNNLIQRLLNSTLKFTKINDDAHQQSPDNGKFNYELPDSFIQAVDNARTKAGYDILPHLHHQSTSPSLSSSSSAHDTYKYLQTVTEIFRSASNNDVARMATKKVPFRRTPRERVQQQQHHHTTAPVLLSPRATFRMMMPRNFMMFNRCRQPFHFTPMNMRQQPRPMFQMRFRHDNISLNPVSKLVHSKPTSHGAGPTNLGVKDDGTTMSSSSEYVASPYQNASSAIAVLDVLPLTFGIVRGQIPETNYLKTMSIPELQPTICSTKDLSLQIDFLPGEDEVKCREDLTYHRRKRKVTYDGELIVTKYRLLFVRKSPDSIEVLVNVPIGMISQIEKIGGQKFSQINDGAAYGIEIDCKDVRRLFFGIAKEQKYRRTVYDQLTRLIFPFSIVKPDITNPSHFFSSFFAWNYKQRVSPSKIDKGWTLYDKVQDYTRMGIRRHGDAHWTINTEINQDYSLCDTYPDVLVLPANFDTSRFQQVAAFRSRNRLPVLSWYCGDTYVTITRASQPLTGLNRKSQDDVEYLQEIANTNVNQGSKLYILDARPKVNAIANKANGGGYEDYAECELEFHNIQNIHVMRESLNKLHSAIRYGSEDDKNWFNDSANSNWLFHIRTILTSVSQIVSLVNNEKRSVLVHCSDGWDRTAQLTSLSMLVLDPYYRTLEGFIILIEKEWISFGHKFLLRIGHADKHYSEQSPVFLQFLDCTYQLLQQFEFAFEFNEKFLLVIADHLYTCQYGTFLLNSEKLRTDMKISEYTMSVWTPLLQERHSYLNPLYNANSSQVLQINSTLNQIKLWKNYYCQHMPDYQSTVVSALR